MTKESRTVLPVVIGRKGSIGEVNFSPVACWPIDTTYFVDDSCTNADLRWLAYGLSALQLDQLNKAAAIPGLNRNDAYRKRILVPPLSEQKRIAAILDAADALGVKRRVTLEKLEALKQSIFMQMFGNPVLNSKIWPRSALSDLTKKVTDGEHLNPQFLPSGMPMVMAGNVLDNFVDIEKAKKVDPALGSRYRKKCNPENGDLLLVSRGATIGRLCIVDCPEEFCLMGSVILIKVDGRLINQSYLNSLLKHPSMRAKLYNTSGSSAQQAIYLKDLKRLVCPVPPISQQLEFESKMQAIERVTVALRASKTNLDTLFTSIRYRAFRGDL